MQMTFVSFFCCKDGLLIFFLRIVNEETQTKRIKSGEDLCYLRQNETVLLRMVCFVRSLFPLCKQETTILTEEQNFTIQNLWLRVRK